MPYPEWRLSARLLPPCVPVLDSVMNALAGLLGSAGRPQVGRLHALDEGYFSRIAAIDFAMRHDDGQGIDDLENADVVLVGVSRTSKTPTCVYLAHRGIRAANVPIVTAHAQLEHLEKLRRPLVVGLTISPDALVQIRRNRQKMLGLEHGDVGRYAKMLLVDDKPQIAFLQIEKGNGGKTRSKVAMWYGASLGIAIFANLYEVISAALGLKGLIGTVNSVTAALSSSLMAAFAMHRNGDARTRPAIHLR